MARSLALPDFVRHTAVPLLLLAVCPPTTMLLWFTNARCGGSFAVLFACFAEDGFLATVRAAWAPHALGSVPAWTVLGVFATTQLILLRVLPGPHCAGPRTAAGNVPLYRANGRTTFAITLISFCLGGFVLRWFDPSLVYDHFGDILGALNLAALALCLALYVRGRLAPSGPDVQVSGNPILDYYWGVELHPRIAGLDIKQLTNARFGMQAWALSVLSFAAAQYEMRGSVSPAMAVCVGLQLLYLAQFFWWETGYFRTMDMQHDRAGFYLCWGTLVWVPAVYTLGAMYLVEHPGPLDPVANAALFAAGTLFITAKNLSNRQRLRVRDTGGQTRVWGKPPRLVHASYTDAHGERRQNLLLASGFWGISRHFHYLGEILGALCWSIVAGASHFMPYFYITYLTVLLFHRARRDDRRCQQKYGRDWDRYRSLVPWKIVPGLY